MAEAAIGPWWAKLHAPSGAHISPCGKYRTLLWRAFEGIDEPPLVFVMLNPSTADAVKPDPTITRCLSFARRERAGGIMVVNLSPWRSAYPKELYAARKRGEDVLRHDDNRAAFVLAREFGPFVLAWGGGIRPWMGSAVTMALAIGRPPLCLGKTENGEPRHPLMLKSDTPLVAYP